MDNLNKYNPAHHPQRYPLGRNPHSAKNLERKRKIPKEYIGSG